MKNKDLLKLSFDSKMDKVDLNSIYGGDTSGSPEITQTTQNTRLPNGENQSDPKTDQWIPET